MSGIRERERNSKMEEEDEDEEEGSEVYADHASIFLDAEGKNLQIDLRRQARKPRL